MLIIVLGIVKLTIILHSNFNNNANNLWEKPFKENMKDSTLVKRNVRLIEEKNLDNWMSEYLDELNKINLKVKEMELLGFKFRRK